MSDTNPRWRDYLTVHPAADLFPPMPEAELRELGEDIKKNGQRYPVVLWNEGENGVWLLDGRNRLDAMELIGVPILNEDGKLFHWCYREGDPHDLVLSLNIHRRHLTEEQRRDLIAKLIKAKPEESDRAIAKKVKRDHKTVAKVRKKMESTGEVSPVEKRVGADGKKRKKPAKPVEADQERLAEEAVEQRATGSAEVSVEERRAQNAALDATPQDRDTERDRKECVALYQKGLDAEREEAEWITDDIVNRAIAAVAVKNDEQRRQFHDKYMKRYGAKQSSAPAPLDIPDDLSIPPPLRRS
jgi:hypothetical protein